MVRELLADRPALPARWAVTPRPARERVPVFALYLPIQPPSQKKKTAENPQSYCLTFFDLLAKCYADEAPGAVQYQKKPKLDDALMLVRRPLASFMMWPL